MEHVCAVVVRLGRCEARCTCVARHLVRSEVQGGGRIECRMTDRQVEIYGHSYQYGRADHATTAQLVKSFFGNDFQVSWGDYGY